LITRPRRRPVRRTIALGAVCCAVLMTLAGTSVVVAAPRSEDDANLVGPATPLQPEPRLTVIAPVVTYPIQLGALSDDGAHLLIDSAKNPVTDASDGPGVWDAIAQRFVEVHYGHFSGASADGKSVAFWTDHQLVPEDTDNQIDVYIAAQDEVRLVSVGTSNSVVDARFVANDGGLVVFRTLEKVLPSDTDTGWDYYAWHRATATLTHASAGIVFPQFREGTDSGDHLYFDNNGVGLWDHTGGITVERAPGNVRQISSDGHRIYTNTSEALSADDDDALMDGYVIDAEGGATLLTPDTSTWSDVVFASDDGDRWLVETQDPLTQEDLDAEGDLFMVSTGSTQLVGGTAGAGSVVDATADLSAFVTKSGIGLIPTDVDGQSDLYRFTSDTLESPVLLTSPTDPDRPEFRAMSDDGALVVFETPEHLLDEDVDDPMFIGLDVYEWASGDTVLISRGEYRQATFLAASDDARRVVFEAIDPLVADDTDSTADVYVSDRDLVPPVASITGPAGGTSGAEAAFEFDAVGHDAVWFDCRLDDGAWSACDGTTVFDGMADGPHTVEVHAFDAAANRSVEPASTTWTVDTVMPVATAPTRSLPSGTAINSGKIKTRISWSGSDAASGIARFELAQRIDGGSWNTVAGNLTGTSADRLLAPQHTYAFRVRAIDHAGNVGIWATGSTFELRRYSESSSKINYSGTWKTISSSVYWGGAARKSWTAGSKASITFTGRAIAWVARTGPNRGKATIYVNGTKVATVDLYSASYGNQRVVWTSNWSTAVSRKVVIRISGTSGRPRVDLDAIVTGS
jgi:hypothetical protein